MMARDHVTFGIGVYGTAVLATSREWSIDLGDFHWHNTWTPLAGWGGAQPLQLVLSLMIVGYFCLVPDIDHPNSTITKKLGWMGQILHGIASVLGGGHRKGAHSIWMVMLVFVGFQAISWISSVNDITSWVAAFCVWLAGSTILKFVLPRKWGTASAFTTAATAALIVWAFVVNGDSVMDGDWLPFAASAGIALHIVGDLLTKGKVYILAPLSDWTIRLPWGFPTGGAFEDYVVRPVCFAWAIVVLIIVSVPAMMTVPGYFAGGV